MGSRHCAKCGEDYSDTYKRCPFCEEEAALRSGSKSLLTPFFYVCDYPVIAGDVAFCLFQSGLAYFVFYFGIQHQC